VKLNAVRRVARRVGDESLHRFLSKTLSGSDVYVDVEAHEAEVLTGTTALIESGRVDFVVLVDIKSVRAHNDSNIIRLGAILDRWQDLGATFADIGSRGGLIPIQQRGSRIVTSRDRSDLIIDARPIRAALQRS
jgi:hypothetical protein